MKKTRRISATISADVDKRFREIAASKRLFNPSWYSEALKEAMELWINQKKKS